MDQQLTEAASPEFLAQVEFDKVRALIEPFCLGEPGREKIRALRPATEAEDIHLMLDQVLEYRKSAEQNERIPLQNYAELDEHIHRIHIEGYVAPAESILVLRQMLRNIQGVIQYFAPERRVSYKELYQIISLLEPQPGMLKAIDKILDDQGEVRSDASHDLVRIRKQIQGRSGELEKAFRSLMQHYKQQGWLTESGETLRNGRRVFSVPAEHKRKISGIIHDESATGRTVFIEPDEIIQINNALFSLFIEERKEIYLILQQLSANLRPGLPHFLAAEAAIAALDAIQAKARFAELYDGEKPVLRPQPVLRIFKGFHPLLLIKNKQTGRKTIPFDLDMHAPNRLLLLSGPNAGGKSITMKAVGLLQIMLQSGLLVPVSSFSEMGIFSRFFADIGDHQSLEEDLSTYSSHLANMRQILEQSDPHTLLLVDEFGSGTDPRMGGAIAEAILREWCRRGVWGVITTHYSNLKIYAFNQKGIVNGAMAFDKENLTPSYVLQVGKPGSSYAFEIANKTGLPPALIAYARKRAGEKENEVDELLIDLQREKQEVEEKLTELVNKEKALQRLISNYEQTQRDMEARRKRFRQEQKETQLQRTDRENRELEKLLKTMKEQQSAEHAGELLRERKRVRKEMAQELEVFKEQVYTEEKTRGITQPIAAGSSVKLRDGEVTGTVESLDRKHAMVQMGDMRMRIALRDLVHVEAPLEINRHKGIRIDTVEQNARFEAKIDIRGFRKDEALLRLETYLDQAALTNANRLEILHGKGDGILKKAVRSKLKEYDFVREIRHPEAEQGGDGITIAELGI